MNASRLLTILSMTIAVGASVVPLTTEASEPTISAMPAQLETQYALSALPPALREKAGVYLLDPKTGYVRARETSNGIECIVERTGWELNDYRDDIYIPLCYDAAGVPNYLRAIMDAAALRAQGLTAAELKKKIAARFNNKTYRVPSKAGLSYMVSPIMRNIGPPDMRVHTMVMPHFMYYAPGVSNTDIGAVPNLNDPASLLNPFIDKQGNAEQSYIIQLVGATEKAKILADEKPLIDALCAYREVLCLDAGAHH